MDRKHSPAGRPNHRFIPTLESLGDRVVPSATSMVSSDGTTLTIKGDASANVVDITDDGTVLTITADGQSVNVPAPVTNVVISLGNGNDTVNYTLTGDLGGTGGTAVTRSFDISLGNGNDTFNGTLNGNVVNGSSLTMLVRGMNGSDNLSFSAPTTNVDAGSALSVTLGGGNGKDTLDTTFGGILLGDLTASSSGGNGKDTVSQELTFNDTSGATGGSVDAEEFGGNAPDRLTLQAIDNSGTSTSTGESTLSSLTATADGGHSRNFFDVTDNVDVVGAKAKNN